MKGGHILKILDLPPTLSHISLSAPINIYIYICVCVCVYKYITFYMFRDLDLFTKFVCSSVCIVMDDDAGTSLGVMPSDEVRRVLTASLSLYLGDKKKSEMNKYTPKKHPLLNT